MDFEFDGLSYGRDGRSRLLSVTKLENYKCEWVERVNGKVQSDGIEAFEVSFESLLTESKRIDMSDLAYSRFWIEGNLVF